MADTQHFPPALLLSALLLYFFFFVCLCHGDSPQLGRLCRDTEREALLQFKLGLHDPANGLSFWVAGRDCCGWSGVRCDNRTGHVVKLDLRNTFPDKYGLPNYHWSLGGGIGPSLLVLKHLSWLDLSGNNFGGRPIPEFMGSLGRLTYLNLSWSGLAGTIPHHLGNLSRLQILDLSSQNLSIDDARWVSRLSSLRQFNMQSVNLSSVSDSVFGALNMLPLISSVKLRNCSLSSFPPLRHVNFTRLSVLYLSRNHFYSPVPEWLPNITSLEYLGVSRCNFTGRIPPAIGNMSSLKVLDISFNSWHDGKLPSTFRNLCKLRELSAAQLSWGSDIDIDEFEEIFSGCIRNSLRSLDLGGNDLYGNFPDWLRELKSLKHLSLYSNSLQGPIPTFLGGLSSLKTLYLSSNNFSGKIPMSLCRIQRLQFLDMSRNNLSGGIPNFWKALSKELMVLNLAHNVLSGAIPSSLGSLSSLEMLKLNSNRLVGELPLSLRNCSRMVILDLGENKFTGKIPTWVTEHMSFLKVLRLRSNNFSGNIPPNLSSLSNLQIIDVADNDLIGIIPPTFGDFSSMKFTHNMSQKTNDKYLYSVDVVTKGIQQEYQKLLPLVISIDLSNNRLSGSMPRGLADLLGLQILNISGNMFTGEIIQNISALHWLESLDLSRNNFWGVIPPLMSSMTFLEHLNLSFNNFSGMIPTTNQFHTFTDPSIYRGNPYLCGFPLNSCEVGDKLREWDHKGESDVDKDNNTTIWLYLSVTLGFIFGFWVIYGTLMVKKRWRNVFFKLIDDVSDQVHVFIIVHVKRLREIVRKKIERQRGSLAC